MDAVGALGGGDALTVTDASLPSVLMFHATLPEPDRKPEGVEVAVHRLANALVGIGVAVTVASLSQAPADAAYVHRRLFPDLPWLRTSRIARLFVLPVLLNTVPREGADVVHYHGDDWFMLRRWEPTVRTLHGTALREAQSARRLRRRILQYAIFPLERLAAKLATIAVAVGADAARVHGIRRVIGNGVDPKLFHPGPKASRPVVLYVGTWGGRKRGRWLYETFVRDIAPKRPDVQLHFVADEAPPPHPQVRFERFPSDTALANAYREAVVFALPSTYEGFGIPYLEAMASGTAVVASPNTGARELLGDGRSGVIASDDVFADEVLRIIDDTADRARLERAGLERARDFSWSSIAQAYADVYREAMHARREREGV